MNQLTTLSNLSKGNQEKKKLMRVGRGPGSGKGKTAGRGHKGQRARSGSRGRIGNEGNQLPLFRKMPHRGFTRGKFIEEIGEVNLCMIDRMFKDGEIVNLETLKEKKMVPSRVKKGVKILAKGELSKKVTIEAMSFSEAAKKKLEAKKISYRVV